MSAIEIDLLGPTAFQQLVAALALRVLGAGSTGFAPGSDGGRDILFRGEAPYPSDAERWNGIWYIQSKFRSPSTAQSPSSWLVKQVTSEITDFLQAGTRRKRPNVWIIATNVQPTAVPESGSYDQCVALVKSRAPWVEHFDIWGREKILDFLHQQSHVIDQFRHLLSPGRVLSEALALLPQDSSATAKQILNWLVVQSLFDQRRTKLEQAGDQSDERAEVQDLFVDLPCRASSVRTPIRIAEALQSAAEGSHLVTPAVLDPAYAHHPLTARTWVITGGPGQGKSTVSQYLAQIHRAACMTADPTVFPPTLSASPVRARVEAHARTAGLWPQHPRIPIAIDLKAYAQWCHEQSNKGDERRGVVSFLSWRLGADIQQDVNVRTLRDIIAGDHGRRWLCLFDGLDEVPSDMKDVIAREIATFLDETATSCDMLSVCTTRPQGYSGQFDDIPLSSRFELLPLDLNTATECAAKLVCYKRSPAESERALSVLRTAATSGTVLSIMKSPLQAHIIAVLVRSGQRPPRKKGELFRKFYEIIKDREASRDLVDTRLRAVLESESALIEELHARLGFLLHYRAESADGAGADVQREEFERIVKGTVSSMKGSSESQMVAPVIEASEERLVLISTPDSKDRLRFDVRQLQEFFAAELICREMDGGVFRSINDAITGDSHWREVSHFVVSSLISSRRWAEIDTVVSAVRSVDSAVSDDLRGYAQAVARGAYLILQLCADGVLEDDLRVRAKFDGLLEPLVRYCDGSCLELARRIDGDATRSWMHSQVLRSILERSDEMSHGGAALIWNTALSSDAVIHEFSNILMERPALLDELLVPSDHDDVGFDAQEWRHKVLIGASIQNRDHVLVRWLQWLLSERDSFDKVAVLIRDIVGSHAEWVATTLCRVVEGRVEKPRVTPWVFELSAHEDLVTEIRERLDILASRSTPATGLPGVWGKLASVLEVVAGGDPPERCTRVAECADWLGVRVSNHPRRAVLRFMASPESSQSDLERTVADLGRTITASPQVGIDGWTALVSFTPKYNPSDRSNLHLSKLVADQLAAEPGLATYVPLGLLGALVGARPELVERVDWGRACTKSFLGLIPVQRWSSMKVRDAACALAPMILREILSVSRVRRFPRAFEGHSAGVDKRLTLVEEALAKFDVEPLGLLGNDFSVESRIAWLLLVYLASEKLRDELPADLERLVVDLHDREIVDRILHVTAETFELCGTAELETSRRVLSRLLRRATPSGRRRTDQVFDSLRERSLSPLRHRVIDGVLDVTAMVGC